MRNKINSFTDLETWQYAHKLAVNVYIMTKSFPKEELFGLTNQIRRCAVSIPSNIAEGFSRSSKKDKSHFYTIALASLSELKAQLLIARDINFLSETEFKKISEYANSSGKLLNGLKNSVNR